jgi:hypothetical protein
VSADFDIDRASNADLICAAILWVLMMVAFVSFGLAIFAALWDGIMLGVMVFVKYTVTSIVAFNVVIVGRGWWQARRDRWVSRE